jgi:hypothetical protein
MVSGKADHKFLGLSRFDSEGRVLAGKLDSGIAIASEIDGEGSFRERDGFLEVVGGIVETAEFVLGQSKIVVAL